MNSKKNILCTIVLTLLVAGFIACSSGGINGGTLFPLGTLLATNPKFLVAVDGVSGANVNVFPINPTSGALGAPVSGSPFNVNIGTDAMNIAVHPNGHFFYVADGSDGTIHMLDVNQATGVPVEIAPKIANKTGTFYEPSGSNDSPTAVLTVTPDGNFLYASNNDSSVGAYKINSNGSLSLINNVDAGACDTGAITSNSSFVWVTDTCGSSGPWNVMTMKINSDGSLSHSSTVTLTQVFTWLWSIQKNPAANFLYVGDEGGDAQVYSFKVSADGSLTQLGPQLVQTNSSDCRYISHSPDGKFFYTSDDDEEIHTMTVDITTGALGELGTSPDTTVTAEGQVEADRSGKFVYGGDQENTGGVSAWTRNAATGQLTDIGSTATANNSAVAIGVVYQ